MAATYDGATGRVILQGDGAGWSRMKVLLPTAPAGTNQAIYVIRSWFDTITTSGLQEESLAWPNPCYYGLKFDANHINDVLPASYADFYGVYMASGSFTDKVQLDAFDPSLGVDLVTLGGNSGFVMNSNFSDAENTAVISDPATDVERSNLLAGNEVGGLSMTNVFKINGSTANDSVFSSVWLNTGSINLDTLDLQNDLDPNNPEGAIGPATGTVLMQFDNTVHGDVFGTNWRPSAGVMAFPTYFMARWPASTQNLTIDYIGVQYSELTTV